jgi:riboflavin synthase
MFTGIVEELGRVLERRGARLIVAARKALDGTDLGGSIAVNGVCLTVVERGSETLAFDVGPETFAVSALGDLAAGDPVNLERPLRMGDFLGGHLVQGHVDGIGVVRSVARPDETARIRVEWQDPRLAPYLIPKGSVAVDGVSLTVAALDEGAFEIMVIPHTLAVTTLGSARPGRRVNLEMDMIGKYVLRAWSLGGRPAGPSTGDTAQGGIRS